MTGKVSSSVSQQRRAVDFYEYANGLSGPIREEKFLNQLSDYSLLKDSAICS
jgi:hypothetical protein